jgi:hypothetical protein
MFAVIGTYQPEMFSASNFLNDLVEMVGHVSVQLFGNAHLDV